jgi:hypothetical protein
MSVSATPWYESASFDCGDPFLMRPGLLASGWFAAKLPFTLPGGGTVYVTLKPAKYNDASSATGQIFDKAVVDAARRTTLRSILEHAAADAQTQSIAASISGKLTGFVMGAAGSVGPKSLFKYLGEEAEGRVATANLIWQFIAVNGAVTRFVVSAKNKQNHEYVYDMFVYEVSVGAETRSFVLSSCFFPVMLLYSKLTTTGGINDKVFTRLSSDRWRTFDITDQKFEGSEWEEYDRDDEYIYFREVGFSNRYRISVKGGKWQHQRQDGTWGTLYATVRAE